MKQFLFIGAMMILSNPFGAQAEGEKRPLMTARQMIKIVKATCKDVKLDGNMMQFTLHDVPAMLVYDETHDRMRVISPVIELKDLEKGQLEMAMAANFHSVLDARYAISDGLVWAAYIHPLSPLTEKQLISAIKQVIIARITFGKEYTSGDLVFPENPGEGEEDAGDEGQKEKA